MTKYILISAIAILSGLGARFLTLGLDPLSSGLITGTVSMMIFYSLLRIAERIEYD